MNKFKIGDKVKIIDNGYYDAPLGSIGTIQKIDDDNDYWINNCCFCENHLELVEEKETDGFNDVEKPKHYNSHPSGVECRDIIRHEPSNIAFAIKYLWRRDLKGNPIQDMEKAIECIKDEIKRYKEKENNE